MNHPRFIDSLPVAPDKRKYLYLILLCLLVGIMLVLFNNRGVAAKNDPVEAVKEFTVKKGDLRIAVEADGKAGFSTLSLKPEINGIIKEIPVKAGDPVKKGDVIVRLDPEKYEIEVKAAEASYKSAQAKLEKAKSEYNQKLLSEGQKLEVLRKEYWPMQQAPDIFASQTIEFKKLALEYAEKSYEEVKAGISDIQMEEANVEQTLANLERARRNLKDTVLLSPANGKVMSLLKKEGESVSSSNSNSNSTEIAILALDDGVYVTANVLELDMAGISHGQEVEVKFESLTDKTYPGKVTEIENLPVNDPGGIVAYEVTARLSSSDERIRSGMTSVVSFIVEQKKTVVIIPNQAVKRLEGSQVVDKVNPDGSTVSQKIKTGFTDGRDVEVLEGLKPGDKIIIGASASPDK